VWSGSYPFGVGIIAGAMAAGTVASCCCSAYAHQLAFGQAGFLMVGGYTSAILCVNYGADPFVALLGGVALSMLIAWVIAAPILRLRGLRARDGLARHASDFKSRWRWSLWRSPAARSHARSAQVRAVRHLVRQRHRVFYAVWAAALICICIGLNIDRSRHRPCPEGDRVERNRRWLRRHRYRALQGADVRDLGRHGERRRLAWRALILRAMDPNVYGFAYSLNLLTGVIIAD